MKNIVVIVMAGLSLSACAVMDNKPVDLTVQMSPAYVTAEATAKRRADEEKTLKAYETANYVTGAILLGGFVGTEVAPAVVAP